MANFTVTTADPLAVKLWAKRTEQEALKQTFVGRFMGRSPDSMVYVKDDLQRSAGDRVRCALVMNLSNAGIPSDGTLEGNEEALTTYTMDVLIDQNRNAVRSAGRVTDQRSMVSLREQARPALQKWIANMLDTWFVNHITGNNTSSLQLIGFNTVNAPAASRLIVGDGSKSTETDLSASPTGQTIALTLIDQAVATAETATPALEPFMTPQGPKYAFLMHPNVALKLKTNATAGVVTWYDYSKSWVQGGSVDSNPIRNPMFGALGEYNNVLLFTNTRMPAVAGTTTVYRSSLLGRQAVTMAFGRDNSENRVRWDEKTFDFGNQVGIAAGMVAGLKASYFNSLQTGIVNVTTQSDGTPV